MAKRILTVLVVVALAAIAVGAPKPMGMGGSGGMVSSHHSSHVGMGYGMMHYPMWGMMGYPGFFGMYPWMMKYGMMG
ncbi:unnamed protein product [Orchesella dallaii]|uniref:Glycine-rich protein n=1 Tax=Orchesella dallaii TaxID=48710 RepID=A0ABP1RV46_9HEXA